MRQSSYKSIATCTIWNWNYLILSSTHLVKTKSPFFVSGKIVGCWTPFHFVSIVSAGMIQFTIVPEWKDAAFTGWIAAMCIYTTLTSLWRKKNRFRQAFSLKKTPSCFQVSPFLYYLKFIITLRLRIVFNFAQIVEYRSKKSERAKRARGIWWYSEEISLLF